MKFCVSALEHASGSVRDETTKVIFQVYRIAGTPVKAYLPPDDHLTRKNPLYRSVLILLSNICSFYRIVLFIKWSRLEFI